MCFQYKFDCLDDKIILRSIKNRFGTINETGFFEMSKEGLVQVPDINQLLLNEISNSPGSTLISSMQGTRPILIELQALCVTSKFGIPQRVITGIDHKRVIFSEIFCPQIKNVDW